MDMTPAPAPEAASLIVVDPQGHRIRVPLEPLPFRIGRAPDSHLIIRDSRASRNHARIFVEGGEYWIEDCDSRHGTFVNESRVTRAALRNSDRIDFGAQDSYQLIFALDGAELKRLMEQVATTDKTPAPHGVGGNLAKLRAILDLARTLQSSFSIDDVLTSVVDTALAITGAERGFLLLRSSSGLETRVARHRHGHKVHEDDLRVPRELIHRALQHRRELLFMNFDPAGAADTRPQNSVADLELRSVVCVPLVRIRDGPGRCHQRAGDRERNGGRAVHGFARGRGRPGGRQPRTAADAGHRSVHRAGERPPPRGGADQTADGRGTPPGPHHPAEPASRQPAVRRLAARVGQQRGLPAGGRRLFRRNAREPALLVGGGGGCIRQRSRLGPAGIAAAGSADHGY